MTAMKSYSEAARERFPELEDLTQVTSHRDRESFLRHLYHSGFATRFLNYSLSTCLEDQTYIPLGSERAIGIVSANGNTLVLRLYHPSRQAILASPHASMLHSQSSDVTLMLVSAEPVDIPSFTYQYDEAMSLSENFQKMRLLEAPALHLKTGRALTTYANKDVCDFRMIDRELALLAITGPTCFPYTFAFDRMNRAPTQIISSSNDDTRMEYVSRIFAEMNAVEAVPQLLEMMPGTSPSVRWQLARDIFRLNAEEGRKVIEHMSLWDDDPHVRNAALKSLAILEHHHGD